MTWTLDQPGEGSAWSYTSTYDDLGATPAISAPDPGHTVTTDNRMGTSPAGAI